MNPEFSIITITLNSSKTIRDTIESVLKQENAVFEYLIIDGGSTDETLDIVQSYKDSRIQIFSGKDSGISDAMNRGIRKAKGKIIGIIHSDDYYFPNSLHAVSLALKLSGRRWCYGAMEYLDEREKVLFKAGRPFDSKLLKKFMLISHPTMFVEKSLYEEFGLYSVHLKYAMDYDLVLRLAKVEDPLYINQTLARMRKGGTTSKNIKAELRVIREVIRVKWQHPQISKILILAYGFWTATKVLSRTLLQNFAFGRKIIPFLRKKVNPLSSPHPPPDQKAASFRTHMPSDGQKE